MIDGKKVFDQAVKSDVRIYDNIRKTGSTGCLQGYPYFKGYYKMMAIDLSKQQVLDADPKAIHQINFTENLNQRSGATLFFIIEEAKETVLDFSQ